MWGKGQVCGECQVCWDRYEGLLSISLMDKDVLGAGVRDRSQVYGNGVRCVGVSGMGARYMALLPTLPVCKDVLGGVGMSSESGVGW